MRFYQEGDWLFWLIILYFLSFPVIAIGAMLDYFFA